MSRQRCLLLSVFSAAVMAFGGQSLVAAAPLVHSAASPAAQAAASSTTIAPAGQPSADCLRVLDQPQLYAPNAGSNAATAASPRCRQVKSVAAGAEPSTAGKVSAGAYGPAALPSPTTAAAIPAGIVTSNIGGKITNSSTAGLANISVLVCSTTDSNCYLGTTVAGGTYTVEVPANDSYLVEASDDSALPLVTYASGYYAIGAPGHFTVGSASATPVAVVTSDVTGINITMPTAVQIAGKVSNGGGTGLLAVMVSACVSHSDCYMAPTDGSGNYSLPVAPNVSYWIDFRDVAGVYAVGYYDSGVSGHFTVVEASATPVAVGSGNVTGINVTLPQLLNITGTTTNSAAAGIPNVMVTACSTTTSLCYVGGGPGDGTYEVPVPGGYSYTLNFFDTNGIYTTGYYDSGAPGHFSLGSNFATPVAVGSGDVNGINVTMPVLVHVSGTVRNPGVTGIANVSVYACVTTSSDCYRDITPIGGAYSIALPGDQNYTVSFTDDSGTYAGGYYDSGATGHFTADLNSASIIDVGTVDIPGINVTLPTAAHVTGTVSNANSLGLANVLVWACQDGTDDCFFALTDSSGYYSVAVVQNESYIVEFDVITIPTLYKSGFYDSGASGHYTASQGSATAVPVAGGDVTGITVTLPHSGATYVPVTPNRLVDSRAGVGQTGLTAPLAYNTPVSFEVTGRHPGDATINIPDNAVAVTGNLTVTDQTSFGYFSLTPTKPTGVPSTSTLNFPTGDNRANAVIVPLGDDGTHGVIWITYEAISHSATADVVFDVTGYFVNNSSGATYVPVTPNRLVDSRPGAGQAGLTAQLAYNTPVSFEVTGRHPGDATINIPDSAVAVTGNLTVTDQTSFGYLSLTPTQPSGVPATSTLNFPTGDNRANAVVVPLGSGGTHRVIWITYEAVSPTATADVVFDVTGYFVNDSSGAIYVPVAPNRLVDSRPGTHVGLSNSLSHNTPASFTATDRHTGDATTNVPSDAVAVTGNVTVTDQASFGYFSLTPTQPSGVPSTSTLNFPIGDNRANAVVVPLGSDGSHGVIWITYEAVSPSATADVIFDVTGYFVK